MNDKQVRILKDMVVAYISRYYPGICLEGPKKTTKTLVRKEGNLTKI
jgi:hypothetical protein